MTRPERCPWIGFMRRCRFEAGHPGAHSWERNGHRPSEAERIIAATVSHLATERGAASTEAEPRSGPAPARVEDTSGIAAPWERAGESVEDDLSIAVVVRAHLLTLREMIDGTAVKLAQAWEAIEGSEMPRAAVARFLLELDHMAGFYRMVAAKAWAAQKATAAGDRIAGAVLRIDGEGSER